MAVAVFPALAAEAQQFTINPVGAQGPQAAAASVRTAPDYSTDVLADPWDFDQAADYVYYFSHDPASPSQSAWQSVPTVQGGQFRGQSRVDRPRMQMIFEGIAGGLNVVGRNGVRFPIDSNKYRRLSFRMKRSAMPDDWFWPMWFTQTNRGAGMGTRVAPTKGFDNRANAYVNQSKIADQGQANVWHIYKIDLDAPVDAGQTAWNTTSVKGLSIDLGHSSQLIGATIDMDWVKLTQRGVALAQLNFSGFGGAVTVTARHTETNDVIQIFPDNGTTATTFSDNSSFTWDYGFLPPGTWVVTAARNSTSVTTTLVVDPAPYVTMLDPDAKGGREYGRTVVGDAYDMTNAEDLTRDGATRELSSIAFGADGLTATTTGSSGTNCPGNPCPDPFVMLLDDSTKRPGTERTIDADVYRHLTFTMEYDHKELTFFQGPPAMAIEHGGLTRIVWRQLGHRDGLDLVATRDIFVLDGGPITYSMDLGAFRSPGNCDTCHLEVHASGNYDYWEGDIATFRIDPYESTVPRWFRLADVRIAADDEPNGNGFFVIRWQAPDATFTSGVAAASPTGSDATVALYYDSDTNPANGRVLIANAAASAGLYNWSVANLSAGRYYVYATITDTAGNTMSAYSGGPVRIAAVIPPATDTSGTGMPDAWRAQYKVTDPAGDADSDGVTNLAEYQQATNPLVSNTWMLPEGATGFFTERIALANPDPTPANVTLTFLRKAPAGQATPAPIVRDYTVLGNGRLSVTANQVAGLSSEEFSTVITSQTGGVVVERTMFWGDLWYGGHTGKAVQAARTQWYLAEGNAGFFQTWILLANATNQDASVTITFLLPGGGTIVQTYPVAANSRNTVFANWVPGLAGKSFSADISSTVPITVERAMYFGETPFWAGGHVVSAVEAPALEWFVAEGRTGPFFDTFLLLANPEAAAANVTVRFLLPGGVYRDANYVLPAKSRTDLWLDDILESQYGFTNTDVSARVTSTNGVPIIVERAMYWPAPWAESHGSAGVTNAGTLWALAEGELGSSRSFDSYILFANPSSLAATVKVTVLRASGVPSQVTFTVAANARATQQASMLGVQPNEQFGLLIESTNNVPIVVERAMYWNGGGQFWGGGSNETAFRLR